MIWKLCPIELHIEEIKKLFNKTKGHKHQDNYIKWPLFEYTKFARMGWDKHLIYYSAGIERPEYNGSIRIMSRHTRDRSYNFGTYNDDLKRGLETLEQSTYYAKKLGYKNIWVSREESPKLLEYFSKHSQYDWKLNYEKLHYGGKQYILRIND
tara:strand:+ start:3290 stop:3748 length:459 start_codon:yes stop_codon:yes gene_type:complete